MKRRIKRIIRTMIIGWREACASMYRDAEYHMFA